MSKSKKLVYVLSTLLTTVVVFKLFAKRKNEEFEVEDIKTDLPSVKPKVSIEAKKEKVSNTELNGRQKEILKLIKRRKVVLPSDIYALHPNVSTRTLRRDMTALAQHGSIRQEGSTRDTKYILIEK